MKSTAPVCFMDGATPPSFSCDHLIIKGGHRKPLHKSEHQVPIQLISVVNSHFSHSGVHSVLKHHLYELNVSVFTVGEDEIEKI